MVQYTSLDLGDWILVFGKPLRSKYCERVRKLLERERSLALRLGLGEGNVTHAARDAFLGNLAFAAQLRELRVVHFARTCAWRALRAVNKVCALTLTQCKKEFVYAPVQLGHN